MFSYQHAFHAGNHADVLKHIVLIQTLTHAIQKEAAVFYVDTHAGSGVYSLKGVQARKSAESETGIQKLWPEKEVPAHVADYLNLIHDMNPSGKLQYYPGSPFIAEKVLRSQDRLRLYELHPAEIQNLSKNFQELARQEQQAGQRPAGRGRRVIADRNDGFAALKAVLPPPGRRAVVLIDPPYENKMDYQKVIDSVADAMKRFPTGTYLIWYPVLQRPESQRFAGRLKKTVSQDWLNVTLSVGSQTPDGFGLVSSGMFVINPPWKLADALKETMPYLVAVLEKDNGAGYLIETGGGKS